MSRLRPGTGTRSGPARRSRRPGRDRGDHAAEVIADVIQGFAVLFARVGQGDPVARPQDVDNAVEEAVDEGLALRSIEAGVLLPSSRTTSAIRL